MAINLTAQTTVNQLSFYENRDHEVLSYRQFGDADDYVILIHGWMTSGIVFDTLLEQADLGNYRIIVPNLRGTGVEELDAGSFSIDHFGNDIIDLANHLNLDKFHVAGHCMGGQVAQWLASELPTRIISLSLISSVPASGLAFPEDLAEAFRNSGGNREVQGLLLEQLSPNMTIREHNRLLNEAHKMDSDVIAECFKVWSEADFDDQLYRIHSPTLVVASDGPTLPADLQKRAVADAIKHAKFEKLDDCGHYPQCERPQEIAESLRNFWAQSTPIPFHLPVAL